MDSEVVGLELMDGSVWYCPRQTLTGATGSYLAARFGNDAKLPPGAERKDAHGRSVYFIARDGQLFGNYILPYLVTSHPGKLLPFSEDPALWRLLRDEATFYGLDGLSNMLHVTKSFSPSENGDQGVLHWLGTNKGMQEYQNPFSIGAVDVTGWIDWTPEQFEEIGEEYDDGEHTVKTLASLPSSRQALVQYRPRVKGVNAGKHMLEAHDTCYLLFCEHDDALNPVVVDLKSIKLHVTAYSIRWDVCCRMTDWNLEATVDGTEWQVLHGARDENVVPPTTDEIDELTRETTFGNGYDEEDVPDEEELKEFLLSYVERKHRHLFYIEQDDDEEAAVFYRYIRFTGCKESNSCLHGVGLELYGNVHQE